MHGARADRGHVDRDTRGNRDAAAPAAASSSGAASSGRGRDPDASVDTAPRDAVNAARDDDAPCDDQHPRWRRWNEAGLDRHEGAPFRPRDVRFGQRLQGGRRLL